MVPTSISPVESHGADCVPASCLQHPPTRLFTQEAGPPHKSACVTLPITDRCRNGPELVHTSLNPRLWVDTSLGQGPALECSDSRLFQVTCFGQWDRKDVTGQRHLGAGDIGPRGDRQA